MSKPVTTWIVVADAAAARFIEQPARMEPLALVEERRHDASRRLSSEIASDGKGRTFDSGGKGRHAVEPHTDPHEHEKAVFAHEIAQAINAAAVAGRFDRLAIAAPARLLGELRQGLDKAAQGKVVAELAKDLTAVKLHDLPRHFAEVVEVPDPRAAAGR